VGTAGTRIVESVVRDALKGGASVEDINLAVVRGLGRLTTAEEFAIEALELAGRIGDCLRETDTEARQASGMTLHRELQGLGRRAVAETEHSPVYALLTALAEVLIVLVFGVSLEAKDAT
jgi:hypothetical protein